MNQKVLKTLEYNKIIDKLVSFAVSPMGKETASKLTPSCDISDIKLSQNETSDAVSMILRKGSIPLGGLREVRPQIKRTAMGGVLSIEELLNIGQFLYVSRRAKNYSKSENKNEKYESLEEYFELIQPIHSLESEIERCIISENEISDDASTGLRSVRREIKSSNDKIREHLNSIINSSAYKNMLQDFVITIRNDRYCVPVKAEYRNSFQGMVHDQSNTGSTLFIEPLSVVNLNNKIRELKVKEKEEIEKILLELSSKVAENIDVIESNLNILTKLDFIFAKANLSISMNGTEPKFNEKGYINISKARHPLLDSKKVVPINIYIGKDFTTLLITGPNTGGKTVAIKTLGIFTLMGQSGLHIPAFDNSELAVFDDVFADIGDEQSIEQSLSTFSAHMSNIVYIMENVTNNSLVLFDELGAGTDPVEGAALALSIIENLRQRHIRTAVTTHYSELKVYALSTEGVENGSCEFNVETLMPTYKLLIGIPGKSNAFAISKRLGLKDDIIDRAKDFISREDARLEDVICDLEISKRTVELEQERAEQYRKEAERLKYEFEKEKEKIEKQRENILIKAKEDAHEIFKNAKAEADRIIKEINKEAKSANKNKLIESRSKLKEHLAGAESEISKSINKKKINSRPLTDVREGDNVYVISFDQRGIVLSKPDSSKNVMVQMGALKIQVPLSELMLDETKSQKQPKQRAVSLNVKAGKSQYIGTEIDCRGQLVEEAIGNVDKFIDDAYLAGLKQVTIIHGKGTGALRNAVQKYLAKNPHVKSYRPGTFGEGENGVTIVEIK